MDQDLCRQPEPEKGVARILPKFFFFCLHRITQIRLLNIALLEQVVLFKPPGSKREHETNTADLSRYTATPMRKKICEETIEASPGAGAGYVGASGWWTGVQPGERSRWQASLMLPVSSTPSPLSRRKADNMLSVETLIDTPFQTHRSLLYHPLDIEQHHHSGCPPQYHQFSLDRSSSIPEPFGSGKGYDRH